MPQPLRTVSWTSSQKASVLTLKCQSVAHGSGAVGAFGVALYGSSNNRSPGVHVWCASIGLAGRVRQKLVSSLSISRMRTGLRDGLQQLWEASLFNQCHLACGPAIGAGRQVAPRASLSLIGSARTKPSKTGASRVPVVIVDQNTRHRGGNNPQRFETSLLAGENAWEAAGLGILRSGKLSGIAL
jgi:hypothetical protein